LIQLEDLVAVVPANAVVVVAVEVVVLVTPDAFVSVVEDDSDIGNTHPSLSHSASVQFVASALYCAVTVTVAVPLTSAVTKTSTACQFFTLLTSNPLTHFGLLVFAVPPAAS
jgi:hypothetical protein